MSFTLIATGTLTPAGTNTLTGLALADLNGDGRADLVEIYGSGSTSTVAVMLSTSLGFAAPVTYATPGTPLAVAIGSVNGDNLADIVTTDSGTLLALLDGTGTGGFSPANSPLVPTGTATSVSVGSVTGSVHPDVVVYFGNGSGVDLLPNASFGFTSAIAFNLTPTTPSVQFVAGPIALADVNGDGRADLVLPTATGVVIGLGGPGGAFPGTLVLTGSGVILTGTGGVAVADLNGDGKPDIIQAAPYGVNIFYGLGNGSFSPATYLSLTPYASAGPVSVADVNGDGRPDLLLDVAGAVYVALAQPSGGFIVAETLAGDGAATTMLTGDINGDGRSDVVVGSAQGAVTYVSANQYTAAQAIAAWQSSGTSVGDVAILDSAANIAANLSALVPLATARLLLNVDFTDPTLILSLTAAQTIGALSVLATIATPVTLSVTGTMTAAQASEAATLPSLIMLSNGLLVADTAQNVATALDALQANTARIGAIAFIDAGTPTLAITASQLMNDAGVLSKIGTAYSLSVAAPLTSAQALSVPAALLSHLSGGLSIADSAANIGADLLALQALAGAGHLAAITLTDGGTPAVPVVSSTFAIAAQVLQAITGAFTLTVSGAFSAAQAAALPASLAAKLSSGLQVVDSAAAVAAALPGLAANLSAIATITLIDPGTPIFSLNATQLLGAAVLTKIAGGLTVLVTGLVSAAAASAYPSAKFASLLVALAVSDSAANITAALSALQALAAAAKLASIVLTDAGTPTLSLTASQVTTDAAALTKIAGSYRIAVQQAAAASVASLAAQANIISIAVNDSAANVAANLSALQTQAVAGKLVAITFTDSGTPTLALSAATLSANLSALALINSGYAIALTGSGTQTVTITATLLPLAVPVLAHITGAWLLAVSGTITAAQAASLTIAVVAHLATPLAITDTAANIAAQLATLQALAAAGALRSITLTNGTRLTITAAQLTADAAALGDLASGITIEITGVTAANATTVAATARVAGIVVMDSWADVLANLAALTTLAKSGKLTAITLTDPSPTAVNLPAASWAAYAAALALITSPYTAVGTAPVLTTLGLPANVVAVIDVNGDGIPDLVTGTGGVYAGLGNGTYAQAATPLPLPFDPTQLLLADVNHDGKPDLVGVLGGAGLIGVANGLGGGAYGPVAFTVLGDPISQIVSSTITNGGVTELAAVVGTTTIAMLDGTTTGLVPTANLTPGGLVNQIALADVNGDGITDVVVATSQGLVIYNGTANGGFTTPVTLLAGSDIASLAVADLNGDWLPDIVAGLVVKAGTPSTAVEVLLNTGTGFAAATGYVTVPAAVPATATVAVGNLLSADGPEIVVQLITASGASQVILLQGNGTGGFVQGLTAALPSSAPITLVDAGDNGRLDILVNGTLYALGELSSSAALAIAQAAALPGPISIADTAADIVANLAGLQAMAASGQLAGIILTDSGAPTLALTWAQYTADARVLASIQSPFGLFVTGAPMASLATLAADPHVTGVSLSDTAANLSAALANPATLHAQSGKLTAIAVSDDGTISIAASLYNTDLGLLTKLRGSVTVMLTDIAGTAQNTTGVVLSWALPFALTDTLHVSLLSDQVFSTGASSIILSGGIATYVPGLIAAANQGSDVVTWQVTDSTTGNQIIFETTLTLDPGPAPVFTGKPGAPSAHDKGTIALGTVTSINGDALRVTLLSDSGFPTGGSSVALNNGTLTYTAGTVTAANAGYDTITIDITNLVTGTHTEVQETISLLGTVAAPFDFFGTGHAALAFQTATNNFDAWTLNGTALGSSAALPTPGSQWRIVGSGNLAGNGMADLVLRNETSGAIAVQLQSGFTELGFAQVGVPSTNWMEVATADTNNDGYSDLAFQDLFGDVDVWLMQGAAMLSSGIIGNPGTGWQVVGAGTFTGPNADLVFQNDLTGGLELWTMNGMSVTGTLALPAPGGDWKVAGIGDLNGDGHPDLVFQNGAGNIEVWLMNGTSVTASATLTSSIPGWHAVDVADVNGDGKSDIIMQNPSGPVVTWLMNGTSITSSATTANPTSVWHLVGSRPMEFITANAPGTYAPPGLESVFIVANPMPGGETITSFNANWDTLVLSHSTFPSFAAVQAATTNTQGGAVIALGNGNNLTLSGLSASLLTSKNILFQ